MSNPSSARETEQLDQSELIRESTQVWWLVMVIGALSVVVGVIVLAKPSHSLSTLTVICGVFVVLDSIFELVGAMRAERSGTAALIGVVGIVVGILLIRHPIHGVLAAAMLIGLWLIAVGVLRLVVGVAFRKHLWHYVVAGVQIAAGIILVSSPHIGFSALALIVGISFIVNGLSSIALGAVLHRLRGADPGLVAREPARTL